MRIGINGSALLMQKPSLEALAEHASEAAAAGFASYWLAQGGAIDALTALAFAAPRAPGIELGTAVIPTYPRHPTALAAQAITVQAATGGRLTLGIGLSHRVVIEGQLGLSFEKPIRHMREYLSILRPLLEHGKVAHRGETLSAEVETVLPETPPPPVLVAALGPQMLRLTGREADGTILWVVGPRTIREHIVPTISAAAERVGRPLPRVVAGLPICVTDDEKGAREVARRALVAYSELPSYRAMLDREGVRDAADVAIIGSEAQARDQLAAVSSPRSPRREPRTSRRSSSRAATRSARGRGRCSARSCDELPGSQPARAERSLAVSAGPAPASAR
jgi:F420-dependent oxidoreductase-like protein